MNERLRTVMLQGDVTVQGLSEACKVDPKTVERWLTLGRTPHRQHRWMAAKLLGAEEAYLWPAVLEGQAHKRTAAAQSELVRLFPNRAAVPRESWNKLINESTQNIDVLVFSGTFLSQMPRIAKMLRSRADLGAQVRLCLGDPNSAAVKIRDTEEGLVGTLSAKIKAALTYFRPLSGVENCELRLHSTTLYNSIFRFDDALLVNPHVWGHPASTNPLLQFKRLDLVSGFFDHYTDGFEAVWKSAQPLQRIKDD
jgi:hypothetical protein